MDTEVDIPKLDWFERYKRLIDFAWNILFAEEDFVHRRWGKEALTEFMRQTRPQWSGALAKRLIEKTGLRPDVEGAIKLLGVYTQELWGYGDPRFAEARLETPNKGTYATLVCRGWEKMKEHCQEINCDVACDAEYGAVVRALSPDFRFAVTKARPRGDDRCEYTVEL